MASSASQLRVAQSGKAHAPAPQSAAGVRGGEPSSGRVAASSAGSRLSALLSRRVQTAMRVSMPHDPAEREAEATARKIMQMPAPHPGPVAGISDRPPSGAVLGSARRWAGINPSLLASPVVRERASVRSADPAIQRQGRTAPAVTPEMSRDIEASTGAPLPSGVRDFMEPRFRADFGAVRVHTGGKAPNMAQRLAARAFTVGRNIFFGKHQFRPETREGGELIAHELTHTIQQQEVVQRSEDVRVSERAPTQVQRSLIGEALDWIADKANIIPGFRMFTIVLGVNPINMSRVDRSGANILRALVEFIPGGGLIVQALNNYGIFEKGGAWIEKQIATLGMVGSSIKQALMDFLDSLGWSDLFHPGRVWDRAKRIFTDPIDRIISFAKGLVIGFINLIKDAILKPIAKLAEGTRGYDLLKAILGRDPVTGESYPQTADSLIGGFMKLIGQEEVWSNIKKANAIGRCWAWFKGAMSALLGFVGRIPGLFISAFKSLELTDIIVLPRAFAKVASVFGGFIGEFISWAGNAVWSLLQIIVEVVAPGAMPYLKRAAAAFRSILKNPIGFVKNLVAAGKQGFQNFATNILTHLKAAFLEWLTGALDGVYIPKALSVGEIAKFLLSVLGITWERIRPKLVKVVGEPVVKGLETAFDVVATLVKEGPAAAWEKIKEQLTNLKDMAIQGIIDLVMDTVVKKAVAKIASMLVPGGAFVQAIISIYDTIMVFVSKLQKIIQVTMQIVDSFVAIAGGQIAGAAAKVESTLAGLLTLAISFLAGFLGLGKMAEKVNDFINSKIRAPIDKAIDALIAWIVNAGKSVIAKLFGKGGKPDEALANAMADANSVAARFAGKRIGEIVLRPLLGAIRLRYGLKSLDLVKQGDKWAVRGVINPTSLVVTDALTEDEGDLSEQELMDMLVGTDAPIRELEAEEQTTTQLSESSLSYTLTIIIELILRSPAAIPDQDRALEVLLKKAKLAASSGDSDEIYKALRKAAEGLKDLYKAKQAVVQIHHEQEVAEHPETYQKSRRERVRAPKKLKPQLDESIKAIVAKYKKMKGKSKSEKRELAQKDIQELRSLIKDSLHDLKESRAKEPDQKRRSKEAVAATAPIKPLEEIDLISLPVQAHIALHRRQRADASK